MKTILAMLLCLLLLVISACSIPDQTEENGEAARSVVYAPTEILLPDGWYFDQSTNLSYERASNALQAGVHFELPPLDTGFVPFIYGTASISSVGELLSIQSQNEDEAPSIIASAAASSSGESIAVMPLHTDALVWRTETFDDGTILALEALYTDHDAQLWLTSYDANGSVLFSIAPADLFGYDISRDIGAQNGGGTTFTVLDLFSFTQSDGTTLFAILSTEGLAAVRTDGSAAWVSEIANIQSAMTDAVGKLILLCEKNHKQTLVCPDPDSGQKTAEILLDPAIGGGNVSTTLFVGGDDTLYACDYRGIHALSLVTSEDGSQTAIGNLLFDFARSEVAPSDLRSVAAVDSNTFYLALEDDRSDEDERAYLYRYDYVPPENVTEKEEIILARLGSHLFLEQTVRDFNKSSDTYRIVIRDYTQYENNDACRLALDTDIAAGSIPDLFLIGSGNGDLAEVYADAGVFADLIPLFRQSPALNYDDMLKCVKSPFETQTANGTPAQYVFPLSYSVTTYIGHPEDFGSTAYASVTSEEMLSFYHSVPADQYIMQNKYDLQKYLLRANIDSYYHQLTGTCSFSNGDLAALMENSQSIYDNAEYLGGNFVTESDFYHDFKAGTLRLHEITVADLLGWVRLQRAIGAFVPVGYPNREGRHYADINTQLLFAASSQTEHLTPIAEFLTLWFARNTEAEYAASLIFSSDIDAVLARFADRTIIENGESSGYVHDNFANDHPGLHFKLTEEDADSLRTFLNSIDARVKTDVPAARIFWEEWMDRGERSWDTVMEAAQSRTEIRLSEQMD